MLQFYTRESHVESRKPISNTMCLLQPRSGDIR